MIAFAGSEAGAQVFGEEKAKSVLAHAQDIKASGAMYCDCPACAACEAILEKKDEILQANAHLTLNVLTILQLIKWSVHYC